MRLNRHYRELLRELDRAPTLAELAERARLPQDSVRAVTELQEPLSLDAPREDGEDLKLLDLIADESGAAPEEHVERTSLALLTRAALAALPEREAAVLRLRFGVDANDEYTLERIGAQLGLSRERVRQLQILAARAMREQELAPVLQDFLDDAVISERHPVTTR